ncbi:MAG: SDR family oxidoreductase [Eubacteriaceae bacterium]|jgi:NAD(P)-dependent dehydrogenase (short-subunit alcohol dehydrogenase family)|nr:SDR family oxidoreductase [Eubacteriaceae bacterium]
MGKLTGKTAIVTGASSGMGKEISMLFAEEGANVIAFARRKERLDELAGEAYEKGHLILPFVGDVSKPDDIDGAVHAALSEYNSIDILVNNAGIMDGFVPLGDLEDELWDRIIEVNLTAPMRFARRAIVEMLKQGSGNIINVASLGGLFGARGGVSYVVAKHGLVGLTKNTGFMYADKGIRCNAICPGGVDTEIGAGSSSPSELGYKKISSGMGAMPRTGSPSEIASVALFLASSDSAFINGTTIAVDGGWSAY